jgi:NAD(P)-dependent dehydrogenase (short-subunit alcohol dehydrogenase family)
MIKNYTLITGAGRGIGYEIAKKFASHNHNLILTIRKKNQKQKLEKLSKTFDVKVIIFIGDLRNQKFVKKLNNINLKVYNVINNAAGENQKHFLKVSEKELNDMIAINLRSVFLISQMFAKKMIKSKIRGNIVSISSQLGHIAAYNRSIYCMTKFGLEGLTKSLSMDLGKFGIRVNSVSPTKTIVNEEELTKNKKRLNFIKKKIPLNKFSTTSEIASIVYFLTTQAAGSITGTSILSDGGWTAGK